MNCSVYIFGELSSGYTQYPEDSSSHILNRLITNCKATTQLVIRRDDNLMYYSYVRKLENNKYVGISITRLNYLFFKRWEYNTNSETTQRTRGGYRFNYSKFS